MSALKNAILFKGALQMSRFTFTYNLRSVWQENLGALATTRVRRAVNLLKSVYLRLWKIVIYIITVIKFEMNHGTGSFGIELWHIQRTSRI